MAPHDLETVTGTRVLSISCDSETGELELDASDFQPWEVAGLAQWLTRAAEEDLEAEEDEEDDED